ncbi:MAG: fructose-bisphosphate aldolase [Candidatus Aenigmarchaeota archaeon]|nr:fructose-bisphosphate aldolase [Candidatus Aenigmarchaeota archaeon]
MLFNKKQKRMDKIINPHSKKSLIIAFDHGVEHGPAEYEGISLDPLRVARIVHGGGANALIVHPGSASYIRKYTKELPLIVKLTARTNLGPKMIQTITGTVKEAEKLGATGVACTIYVGSEDEDEMLENFCEIKKQCLKRKMPLIGFMYPRVKGKKKNDVFLVRYAARVGAELGVDIVKTYYTGSNDTFGQVVKDAGFIPVLAAGGGPKDNEMDFFQMVKDVMVSGASGMVIGRNIWAKERSVWKLRKAKQIIHGGAWK